MFRNIVVCILILSMSFVFASCKKETKKLTCDGCGNVVEVEADSNMTDEWILFCEDCGDPGITD